MRYLGDDEATQLRGIDLYQGTDGNLYEWVDGVDEWGEQELSEAEGPVLNGLGALYAAPDGTLYQMQGLAEEEAAGGGQPSPRAQGPRRPPGSRPPRKKKKGGFFKKLLPIAKFAAGLIPGGGAVARAAIDVAEKALTKPGVAGYDGLGALYAAPDGSLYQIQGMAEDELRGFAEDEELKGYFAADEELRGFAADEELRGLDADEELRGFDADEELRGFEADEDLRGFAEDQAMQGIDGYVRQDRMSGLDAYVPPEAPQTRWHVTPVQVAEIWKPLW